MMYYIKDEEGDLYGPYTLEKAAYLVAKHNNHFDNVYVVVDEFGKEV